MVSNTLLPLERVYFLCGKAEKYKQKVMGDNDARKRGRYEVWNSLHLGNNIKADSLIRFLTHKKTFVSPTLAAFEMQPDKGDSIEVNGFRNMVKFVGMAKKGGVRIVVGSHSWVAYAKQVLPISGKWNSFMKQG